MTRGRKKKEDALNENITIRVTKAQKEVTRKNEWLNKEVAEVVRNFLQIYVQ